MVISFNSQLGLRFKNEGVKIDFLSLMKEYLEKELGLTEKTLTRLCDISSNNIDEDGKLINITKEEFDYIYGSEDILQNLTSISPLRNKITDLVADSGFNNMIDDKDSKYFFICDSVYEAAKYIYIKQNFTGRILKDIRYGKYTYLLGKNRMVRFIVVFNAIKGFYYDSESKVVFEWGIEMDGGQFYFSHNKKEEFTAMMKVLTFVELGDIETKVLEAGKNNGVSKKAAKVTNTSEYSVYVVDSSWNKIIIRTDGFAVRGHFRLQPCGEGRTNTKLVWINAFEKHGYHRNPTGKIIREY